MSDALTGTALLTAKSVGWKPAENYAWTQSMTGKPLAVSDVDDIVGKVKAAIAVAHLIVPDEDLFVRRAVLALLSGHLVLQGPPGTGKTTLARILAEAFDATLEVTTATADWSTYDVVGGLRPSADGSLVPALGAVSRTALQCADAVRQHVSGVIGPQAAWLLIDELNRADIDKAIGSLYTVLSSVSVKHLEQTPLELWFEESGRDKLWIPSRFRIIGTMNDVDTSFVNTLSQGLTRRFQFLFLGVSTDPGQQVVEIEAALTQAREWVSAQYEASWGTVDDTVFTSSEFEALKTGVAELIKLLRDPNGIAWPLGTAQIVDVWRVVCLGIWGPSAQAGVTTNGQALSDQAIADLVIPQAGSLHRTQLTTLSEWFASRGHMPNSVAAVNHLLNTSNTY